MKRFITSIALCLISGTALLAQTDPWKKEQLIKPAQLAEELKSTTAKQPVIFNVGPMGQIKGAVKIGAVSEPKGAEALGAAAAKLTDKNDHIVVYCGCCTSQNCPNIRPAFKLLTEKGFKHVQVLEIEHGYVEDWQGQGYPVEP